jgi:hypothetical protein
MKILTKVALSIVAALMLALPSASAAMAVTAQCTAIAPLCSNGGEWPPC